MKTLNTKTINVVLCWNNIRTLPPREFASIDEMEKAVDVIAALAVSIPEFVKVLKDEQEALSAKRGTVSDEEYQKSAIELNKKISALEVKEANTPVKVGFENEEFSTFFQFCEKWAKNWFATFTEYLQFRKDLNVTNSQPKNAKDTE